MLPVPESIPVSQLLARVNHDYARVSRSSTHKYIRAKRIFVRDLFEIVNHQSLVSHCFSDFMEITIKAIVKPKLTEVTPKETAVSAPANVAEALDTKKTKYSKKFPNEKPAEEYIKKPVVSAAPLTKSKLKESSAKSLVSKSPEKETKNAKKKRERKEAKKAAEVV